jgi:multisubunit Na+/H+ antiporter MnhC subunit
MEINYTEVNKYFTLLMTVIVTPIVIGFAYLWLQLVFFLIIYPLTIVSQFFKN